jgi:hypothetical protein
MTHDLINGALAGMAVGGVIVLLQVAWVVIRHGVH